MKNGMIYENLRNLWISVGTAHPTLTSA